MAQTTRLTRRRAAVSDVLAELAEFRSAQEIHDILRRRGEPIGLSTVYRTLQTLAEAGDVDVLRQPSGESVYRRCSTGHHHHLVCRRCGRTVEVAAPAVERWARELGSAYGFTQVGHTVEVFGVCPTCSASEPVGRHGASDDEHLGRPGADPDDELDVNDA